MPPRRCPVVCSNDLAQNAAINSHKNSRCRSREGGLLGRADKWVGSMGQSGDTSRSNATFQNSAGRPRDEIRVRAH